MKWKKAEHGDERTLIKFAFLPKTLSDKTAVWFKEYKSKERYTVNGPKCGPSFPEFWLIERKPAWVEKESSALS